LAVSFVLFRPDKINPVIPITYTYEIVNTFPHDQKAFTQGLVFEDSFLYEGTGLNGRSSLRKVEVETGKVLQVHQLLTKFFGEGVTICGDNIIQLTYQSNTGFVYNKNTFELLREFNYPTEGWGITHDGGHLIMSDGTPTLYFLDPETFEQVGRMKVYDESTPLSLVGD
jgi:glutamine cyclotransferase